MAVCPFCFPVLLSSVGPPVCDCVSFLFSCPLSLLPSLVIAFSHTDEFCHSQGRSKLGQAGCVPAQVLLQPPRDPQLPDDDSETHRSLVSNLAGISTPPASKTVRGREEGQEDPLQGGGNDDGGASKSFRVYIQGQVRVVFIVLFLTVTVTMLTLASMDNATTNRNSQEDRILPRDSFQCVVQEFRCACS